MSRHFIDLLTQHLLISLKYSIFKISDKYFFVYNFSIEKMPSILQTPVLVIHGTEDEVIDFSHGLAIYEAAPKAVEPLWVEGAGHNDVELYSQYLERLKQFVQYDLVKE